VFFPLRQQVAILAKDKFERFGILVPFEHQRTTKDSGQKENGHHNYEANDFAARCYIGNVKEVLEFLAAASDTDDDSSSNGGVWKPSTPPLPSGGWKPSTPPPPNNGGGSFAKDDDDDDGPTFRPDDDDDDGPTFRPDDDDDDGGNSGWKPTSTPNNNSAAMPWDTSGGNDNAVAGNSSMPWDATPNDENDNNESTMPWNNDTGATTSMPWDNNNDASTGNNDDPPLPWATNNKIIEDASNKKRSFQDMNGDNNSEDGNDGNNKGATFHTDTGAAAADAFYSGLTRNLATRDRSMLYHMKCFNNWVKATQIAELDPKTTMPKQALRVLDLACGKGGDLTKWTIHQRGMRNYVGIDVARGSLKDAAERARSMRKNNRLQKAVFACADLGSDVPGRKRNPRSKQMQKLLTWSIEDEAPYESGEPKFNMVRGGGIKETDRFDIVSIQFAIHYMMQTRKRARRFFHTVSQLLDVGGNLAFTTIDAMVIVDHIMNLGHNYHFEEEKDDPNFKKVVVEVGGGACRLTFEKEIVQKIIGSTSDGTKGEDDLFGLEYTFTLVEGDDHAAGMGDAVNLPEWLTPLPVLVALAKEAGLELEYAQNFHKFFQVHDDPMKYPAAHRLLNNMKVPNRMGTISDDEWSIIRLYMAVRFRKVRESSIVIDEEGGEEHEQDDNDDASGKEDAASHLEESNNSAPTRRKVELDPIKAKKMYPMAMMKAKKIAGDQWNSFSREEKEERTQIELETLAAK